MIGAAFHTPSQIHHPIDHPVILPLPSPSGDGVRGDLWSCSRCPPGHNPATCRAALLSCAARLCGHVNTTSNQRTSPAAASSSTATTAEGLPYRRTVAQLVARALVPSRPLSTPTDPSGAATNSRCPRSSAWPPPAAQPLTWFVASLRDEDQAALPIIDYRVDALTTRRGCPTPSSHLACSAAERRGRNASREAVWPGGYREHGLTHARSQ